jgi:DNA processing protein
MSVCDVLRPGMAAWPARLGDLHDPPARLHVRGDVRLLAARSVAIVGTRESSGDGWDWTHRTAGRLAEEGIVVVSGLARGIDAAAHLGALEAGGDTVAVLGCGPDVAYPEENAALLARVADRGTVVSELPPGAEPRPWNFPRRNRLIAALAEAVVVVEARLRSGALVTARLALELGREIFVVPGWPGSPLSAGPLALLRDGARPIRNAEDLLEDLAGLGSAVPAAPEHQDALAAVRAGAGTPQELGRALSLDGTEARERWAALELLGHVAPRKAQ